MVRGLPLPFMVIVLFVTSILEHFYRCHMVSDIQGPEDTHAKINQDANVFVVQIECGRTVSMEIREGRQAYLLCVEGECDVICGRKDQLVRHDAAEIVGPTTLVITPSITCSLGAHLLLVEMKLQGEGRKDL
jgi:quercetin 2,3-dioxygenase